MGITGADLDPFRPNQRFQTEPAPQRISPILGFARALIVGALADALETENGQPTEHARDAVTWLEFSCNWTTMKNQAIPPTKEIRDEYFASFSWACQVLGWPEEQTREFGPPRATCRATAFRPTVTPKHRQRTRAAVTGGKHSKKHTGGMREVRQVWQRAAEAWAQGLRVTDVNAALITQHQLENNFQLTKSETAQELLTV